MIRTRRLVRSRAGLWIVSRPLGCVLVQACENPALYSEVLIVGFDVVANRRAR